MEDPSSLHCLESVLDDVVERLFHLIDLVELVLEVNAAEEERHHRIEAEAERLGPVEVLFQRVSQGEAGDEANDPSGKAD